MKNKFNVELTDEEEERYIYLKELSIRHYPKLSIDETAANMAENLYIYYAKHNSLPDPKEEEEASKESIRQQPRIIEYRTPADAGDTLIRE